MIRVRDLDHDLAFKLGDPVQGNSSGEIFKSELRLGYIQRAVYKLMRNLPSLMLKYSPLFTRNFSRHIQAIKENEYEILIVSQNGDKTETLYLDDLKEIFVKVNDGTEGDKSNQRKVTYVEPEDYLVIHNENSGSYSPEFSEGHYYYTILDGKICLAPKPMERYQYEEISLILGTELSDIGIDSELPIPHMYTDLILTLASVEGMHDIGRSDKVGIYTNEINSQLRILTNYASFKIKNEGSEINE